jgi:hypothetical protein
MPYNLFLDDFREPEDAFAYTNNQLYLIGWTVVRNYDEFVKIVEEKGVPEMISFDHDLADEHYESYKQYGEYKEKTGYHCAKWFINYCIDNKKELPAEILIHSMNPAGSANIKSLFDTYNKYFRI